MKLFIKVLIAIKWVLIILLTENSLKLLYTKLSLFLNSFDKLFLKIFAYN